MTLALLVVLVILVFSYAIMSQRLRAIENAINNTTKISNHSVEILRINKDIVELQRDVNVYGSSGSNSIFEKISENFSRIETSLNAISAGTMHPTDQTYLDAMSELIERYKNNLDVFYKQFETKTQLIEQDLPAIYTEAIARLENIKKHSRNATENTEILEQLNIWHSLHRDALLFLDKKDYSKRKSVDTALKLLSVNRVNANNTALYEEVAKTTKLSAKYANTFRKSIQANRNYLTLVNVVMSGDSIEFSTLANSLRESSLNRLADIKKQNEEAIKNTEIVLLSLSLGIIFYIVLFGFFIQSHISYALKRLTVSFSRFIKGDLSAPITDLKRTDEIGKLAIAADTFRKLSKDLKDAKLEAERISKVKSEFLANMSHEIRTPMNGILGMARQLENSELTEKQAEMLNIIQSSGDSLLVIINDILDLSKIEASKIQLENTVIDLSFLLHELEQLFIHQAAAKGIQLFVSKSQDEDVLFYGDKTRLKQVLINLLGNAIKFTEVGSVSLYVQILENDDTLALSFSVTDTGIGISEDNIDNLFEAFSQADTSITRRFGGTGLGLAIASKLLKLMGSPLQVESELDKGSHFYFNYQTSRAKKEEIESKSQQKNNSPEIDISTLNVLVVEDNEVNRIVIKALLAEFNITQITIAEDGQKAIEACQLDCFDIILMDMQMPVMGGTEATKHIRKMPNFTDTPIIALTANVLKEDKQRCYDAGMDDFIAKPINHDKLKAILYKWFNRVHS